MYMNLTIGDMFKTWSEMDVFDFFDSGLRRRDVVMTLSALEELMKRDQVDLVRMALSCHFKNDAVVPCDDFYATTMINSLTGYGRRSKVLKEVAKRMWHVSHLTRMLRNGNIPNGSSQEELDKKIQNLNREIIDLLNNDELE